MKIKLKLKELEFKKYESSLRVELFDGRSASITLYLDKFEKPFYISCYRNIKGDHMEVQDYSINILKEALNQLNQKIFDKFIEENVTMEVDNAN